MTDCLGVRRRKEEERIKERGKSTNLYLGGYRKHVTTFVGVMKVRVYPLVIANDGVIAGVTRFDRWTNAMSPSYRLTPTFIRRE